MERAFVLLDRGTRWNGVQVVTLRGPVSEELLRAGLLRMQARHPFMRARLLGSAGAAVDPDDSRLRISDTGGPLPIATLRRQSDAHWQSVVETELNEPFDLSRDYLTRVTLLLGPSRSELILSHHHVTGDALSIVFAVRDLLTEMAAMATGEPLPMPESLPILPTLGELLPAESRGFVRRYRHMNAFFEKNIIGRAARRAQKLPHEQEVPPQQRRNSLLHRALAPEETQALVSRCRAEGCSVHGTLCAALLLATADEAFTARLHSGTPTTLGCWSAVSLRDQLEPPVGEAMGLFISQVTTFHDLVPPPSLFALAREVKSQLGRTLAQGEQYVTMPMIGLFVPWGKNASARFIERFDGASAAALGVTNVQRLPIPSSYGPFTLENYQITVGLSVVGQLLGAVTTFADQLNFNLVFSEPLVSRARAERIVDGALRRLREGLAAEQAA